VLAAAQVLAAVLRIGAGRWSDVVGSRTGRCGHSGSRSSPRSRSSPSAATAPASLLVPLLVFRDGLSMAWNGLAFTIAAELGGSRSGAAIGLQQTVLGVIGVGVPIAFAAAVDLFSWARRLRLSRSSRSPAGGRSGRSATASRRALGVPSLRGEARRVRARVSPTARCRPS
jgi:hypothetical protein